MIFGQNSFGILSKTRSFLKRLDKARKSRPGKEHCVPSHSSYRRTQNIVLSLHGHYVPKDGRGLECALDAGVCPGLGPPASGRKASPNPSTYIEELAAAQTNTTLTCITSTSACKAHTASEHQHNILAVRASIPLYQASNFTS